MLALLASVAGLAISVYLTVVHFSTIPLACPANAVVNCEQVLTSPYAVIAGTALPTSAAGIVWFAISAGLALSRRRRALLAWIVVARRDETRARRIEETAAAAQLNERAHGR